MSSIGCTGIAAGKEGEMKTKWKIMIITIVVGATAFLLGPMIWSPSPDIKPTAAQMPYMIVLSALEALVFGFGVAFIFYGWRFVKHLAGLRRNLVWAIYISLAWLLISWWPHDNLHIHNALYINGLIAIEYSFHVTVIVAGLVLAYSFFALFKPVAEGIEAHEECAEDQPNCHPTPVHS